MKKKRRPRPDRPRRRGIYILPNLFTSASLFSGFYSIIASFEGRFEAAAVAIIISCVLDGLDGRVARITNTTTKFGIEYDSLSDLVAFGVAPAVMAYLWALQPIGRLGWLACFMFVACGALRLARFNVQKDVVDPSYFRGLPIPAAACFVASVILFEGAVPAIGSIKDGLLLVIMYLLSFVMVSTLNYVSFKKLQLGQRKPFRVLVAIILSSMVIAYMPSVMFFVLLLVYVISGPVMTALRIYRRRKYGDAPEPQTLASPNSEGESRQA